MHALTHTARTTGQKKKKGGKRKKKEKRNLKKKKEEKNKKKKKPDRQTKTKQSLMAARFVHISLCVNCFYLINYQQTYPAID